MTSFYVQDLWKFTRSCKQLCLVCLPDPNIYQVLLTRWILKLSWVRQCWENIVLFGIKELYVSEITINLKSIWWYLGPEIFFQILDNVILFVRRAGLLWSQQDFEWLWSVPLSSASLYGEFSFILFDLCLFMTIFNFILNYVPTVTFWIFTYHKIWILLIIFCFIWSYWIIYFLTCLEVFWSVVS